MVEDYTLCEIAYLNEAISDVANTRRVLLTMGMGNVAMLTIGNSRSLPEKNALCLYQGYGGNYGSTLYQLFNTLLENAIIGESSTRRYSLGQLAWLSAVALNRTNVRRQLTALGYDRDTVVYLSGICQQANLNIAAWWVQAHKVFPAAAQDYLDSELLAYPPGWPHAVSTTPELPFK